jgi:PTH2 family peptidyl-tRNA hydrolase
MSSGKLAAQVGHSIHSLCNETDDSLMEAWEDEDSASKIVVLGVKDLRGLEEIIKKAESMGIGAFAIQDAGRTEVDPGTTTVAAIGPCYECLINLITGNLRPYKDPQPLSPEESLKRSHEQSVVD